MRSFWEGKNYLKIVASLLIFCMLFKRFRSFIVVNMESVDWRTAKLLAFKVGGLKKKSAIQPRPHSNHLAHIRERPGSNHSQILMAGNFAAPWPTDSKFLSIKDLNLFQKYTKTREASSILRVIFAISKWPHLHRKTAFCPYSFSITV